jgi:uncharacterized lipoprotein YbaY
MRRIFLFPSSFSLLLPVLFVSACGTAAAPTGQDSVTVSGTAAYRQRVAMPPEAVLTVRVEDVSRAGAPATVMAESREAFGSRQVPIPFTLKVPRSAIDPRARYSVRATITVNGQLAFTTDTHQPVLTGEAKNNDIALMLVPVASPSGAPRAPR